MEERELLSFILGYLHQIHKMEEVPSEKVKSITDFYSLLKTEDLPNYDSDSNNISSNQYDDQTTHYDNTEYMEGFDYDTDYDQQDPDFW